MTVYEKYITGDNGSQVINDSTDAMAQTFTPSASHTITSVRLKVFKSGTTGTPGNAVITIRSTDDGKPTAVVLATATVNANNWDLSTGSFQTITFTAGANLTVNTKYAIVITCAGADANSKVSWRADATGTYTRGNQLYSTDGINWVSTTNLDFMFEERGDSWFNTLASIGQKINKQLVAASMFELWYGDSAEDMNQLAASVGDIDGETHPLKLFELYGKVFVANGPNLKVADFTNIKITTTDIGSHPPDFGTVLTATGGAKMVVDYITSLTGACTIYGKRTTSDTFGVEGVTGTDDDDNAISFTGTAEVAPPHWYDWTVFGNSATFGVMPSYAGYGCNYRGRAHLTADEAYPHQWYESRQRNPWNWLYGQNDAQSAVRGGDADAGEIGGTVIVSIPYKDDFIIHACADSLWYLSGDAAEGGSINELDLTTGMLGDRAFCWDKDENLYMLTTRGITRIPSGFGRPEFITEDIYPDFIKDLAYDPALHRITMGYHRTKNIIKISKTTLADGSNSCWVYDLMNEGLFPETYPEECGAYSMFWYEAKNPDYKTLLHGCFDGFIRYEDDSSIDDNIGATTEAINSYVAFGPITLGPENREGMIHSLNVVTTGDDGSGSGANSNNITYKIFVGRSADGVIKNLIANSGQKVSGTIISPGRPHGSMHKRKIKGVCGAVRLHNSTAGQTWGFENLSLNVVQKGRIK